MAEVLAYLAAAVIAVWGVSHAIPTRQVVAGFEQTAVDNHRVVLPEWIIESVAMWGVAGLVVAVTMTGGDMGVVDRRRRPAGHRERGVSDGDRAGRHRAGTRAPVPGPRAHRIEGGQP